MLPISPPDISAASADYLDKWTGALAEIGDYADRVAEAKAKWKSRRSGTKTMADVAGRLTDACAGPRRCMYCEDSLADEVEHIRPKDIYPDMCFSWANYLLSCGPCNGPKNNHFAVFDTAGEVVEVSRKHGEPVSPPTDGPEVFIDPRSENPLELLELDLEDTLFLCAGARRGDPGEPTGQVHSRHAAPQRS